MSFELPAVEVADGGELTGAIAVHRLGDRGPTLEYDLAFPVRVGARTGRLAIELRHPQARGWRALAGRTYQFDIAHARTITVDGERVVGEDVAAEIRTATEVDAVRIETIAFGAVTRDTLAVRVVGAVCASYGETPFAFDGTVRIGPMTVRDVTAAELAELLDVDDYEAPTTNAETLVFIPRAQTA